MSKTKNLILIDGSGFIFRAYHALPPLTRPDGTPVGAVMGFCNMLVKLKADYNGNPIAVIFDAARKNFRNDIYPDYKANRPPTPEDLIPQFPLIREAAQAFGLPTIECEGFEADDLIATYARLASEQGLEVTIVSSDKDLMQLIRTGITMYDPMKAKPVGESEVFEKFGVPPAKVTDVQALCGDSSDHIPGVAGIGVKTAAELITTYGSLENLLAHVDEIKQPKRREALTQQADLARISYKLVTLCDTAPAPLPVGSIAPARPDPEQLAAFLMQQGFKSLAARLHTKLQGHPLPAAKIQPITPTENNPVSVLSTTKPEKTEYLLMTDAEKLAQWLKDAHDTGTLAVDTETTGLTPAIADLVGISLATRPGRACYIPVGHSFGTGLLDNLDKAQLVQAKIGEILPVLQPFFTDPTIAKIGHNIKFDLQMLRKAGFDIDRPEDTMLLSYVLDGTAHGHGLDDLARDFCGHTMISYDSVTGTGKSRISFAQVGLEKAKDYAAEDADLTLQLYHIFKPRLAREKMTHVYEDIERPLVPVIARMEECGVRVSPEVLRRLSQNFAEKIAALEGEIHALAGHPFNIASPKQLGQVLFEELGLQGGSKTKTGDWSTSADILEVLAEQGHAIVEKVLDFRHLSKLRSTYTESLQEEINPRTGRVHTSFAMALTNTGRLSSSDPNLQNIPIRSQEGRMIREAFIAKEGHVLLSADYSQIELRLVAELAGIKALKEAFAHGEDIHARTASEVLGIPLTEVTPDIRRQAKAINFGIIYGISGFGLAKQLGCSVGEASTYIKTYMARFPELGAYMESKRNEARQYGYVKTLAGRKCVIAGIHDKNPSRRNFAERQAINAPLQGTAADIIKIAMIQLDNALRDGMIEASLLLQVHDELVFEVPRAKAEGIAQKVKEIMESVSPLSLPLLVATGWASNWAEAH
ncbi:MAG: DNA polymerase I [Pseudobdellovibrionaceae bacterium]